MAVRVTPFRRRLATVTLAPIACFAVLLLTAAPVRAVEVTTRIIRDSSEFSLFLPCANGGAGEVVVFSGTFMDLLHSTQGGSTGTHVFSVEINQGVAGVGVTTGDRYVFARVNMASFNQTATSFPVVSSQELIYRITGPGPDNDALIRIVNHATVNANGETTVAFDELTVVCEPTDPDAQP
jgi:hypothetical protein